MVAVGIAPSGMELGVDVENGSRKVDLSIADHYFAPPELAWLTAQAEAERGGAFMTLWTLKEAFIKATGKGLSQELDRFWFADPATGPIRVGFASELPEDPDQWGFEHRVMPGDFHLSVAWRGPGRVAWSGMPE
jgi:4'-phosphopantetheinyl transferase